MRRLVSVAVATVLVLSLAGTAFAAKGGNGKGGGGNAGIGSTSAACAVDPNPAAVGGLYAVTATGLPTDLFVNVDVSDSVGTSVYMTMTDATGSLSVTGSAAWAGTSTVTVVQPTNNKPLVLATCSFEVS